MPKNRRVFSTELKLKIVKRMLAGESARDLAREVKVSRTFLYRWTDIYRRLGPAGFVRRRGRPPVSGIPSEASGEASVMAATKRRVAELERKIGQQQVELDFFRRALRQVEAGRRAQSGPGAKASTRSSKR
jgi:transposase-like protein